MRVTVIGTGYVGLVTGACLAEVGNHVVCVDVDAAKIDSLRRGEIPIFEPGLASMVEKCVHEGRLRFTTDLTEAAQWGAIQFIAVGTPPDEDGSADLQHVLAAARNIARAASSPVLVVNKSTVPVGTAAKVRQVMEEELGPRAQSSDFMVASNPEFLKEGAAIADFMRPDRIVIGVDDPRAEAMLRELYAPFQRNRDRLLVMDIRSAELTKYAANAMLATRISFMNELALLSEKVGADVEMVRIGIGSDSRIGYDFLYPGCGYGGSCFPKDVRALRQSALENGVELKVIEAVESANELQKTVVLNKICSVFGDDLAHRVFALWGLAFKPNTDDMRDAPSRAIIDGLISKGARVQAFDPAAMPEARRIYPDPGVLKLVTTPEEALDGADALVIATEWTMFRSPDWIELKQRLKRPLIFDGRNMFDPVRVRHHGFEYHCIGR